MTDPVISFCPESEPGIASAEDGVVILDGPDGVAVTMTPHAAMRTGQSLIAAAEMAEKQLAEKRDDQID